MSHYANVERLQQVYPIPLRAERFQPFMVFRALTESGCSRIIKKYRSQARSAGAGEYGQEISCKQKMILPMDEPTLFSVMATIFSRANEHYRYALSGIYEPFRFLEYSGADRNSMHSDYGVIDRSKLSFSIKLNEHDGGGGLRILNHKTPKMAVGDAIVFPSWTAHEAAACKSVRYSLVGWAAGPHFA